MSGLTYSTGGTTATTNQDGLLYYFPSNPVSLSLGNVTLGTFVDPIPGVLTPYNIFDVNEGTVDDRVTNFARLLQSFDLDADPQNGIQLNSTEVSNLNPNLDFSDNSSFAGLAVPAERALRHLASSMKLKNLGNLAPFATIPGNLDNHTSTSGLIGVVFDENLRASTIQPNSLQLLESNSSKIAGRVFAERNWLLFEPDQNLPTYGNFTATVAQGLLTQTGRSLQADFSWSFATADHPSSLFPRLIQLHPDNNSTGVPTNSVLSLTSMDHCCRIPGCPVGSPTGQWQPALLCQQPAVNQYLLFAQY